ncbi:MAG TPA: hypothetical protein VGL59_03665 [Polyangia bacterium]
MIDYGLFPQVVLGLSVPLIISLFVVLRPPRAAAAAVLGAEMFLPELVNFRIPFLPPLDKHNLPYIAVLIGCVLTCPNRVLRLPKERWFLWLSLALLVGGVATGMTNDSPIPRFNLSTLPALTIKDGLFTVINRLTRVALPFFLGTALFRTSRDLRDLLTTFVVAGLVYIPFCLIELRLSPQWHNWIYGYGQHAFDQTLRWGGYRPMVFMAHGLALARFFVVAALVPLILRRGKRILLGVPIDVWAVVLFIMLVLCKSTGAIIYVLCAFPALVWLSARTRASLAMVLGAVVFLYPLLRTGDLVPTRAVLDAAGALGPARAQSLAFRFENEDVLLAKARSHFVFGWGEYGRNTVYDGYGGEAVGDGFWIIEVGITGLWGFVCSFGILLTPIFLAGRRLRRIGAPTDRQLVAGTAFLLAILAVDLLPNGLWAVYPFLIAGALSSVSRDLAFGSVMAGDSLTDELTT